VEIASTPKEWAAAIARQLGPAGADPERRRARQDYARQYDWQFTVRKIADSIASQLGFGLPQAPDPEGPGSVEGAPGADGGPTVHRWGGVVR